MKQFVFTLIVLFGLSFGLQAQNYEMSSTQDTILYNPADYFVYATPNLKNISGATVSLFAERRMNSLAPGHATNFCWGTICLGNDDNSSALLNESVSLKNNDIDSTFKLTLLPDGKTGTTKVTMRFYNVSDATDFLDYTVVLEEDPTASITEGDLARGFDLSNPYPNPASTFAWIDYELPANVSQASLRISDMQGRVIGSQVINTFEDRAQIQTSELATGVYFVNLMAEDRIIAVSKLRVK